MINHTKPLQIVTDIMKAPSRRYTCQCGSKGRRGNSDEARNLPPICPACDRYHQKKTMNDINQFHADLPQDQYEEGYSTLKEVSKLLENGNSTAENPTPEWKENIINNKL